MGRRGEGTRRERRARGGEWSGGRAKDTRARRGAGVATKGAATETLALGLQGAGRGTEGITPSGRNGERKSIQRSVRDIHDRVVESDEILKVNGSDRNQERLREVVFTMVPTAHGEVKAPLFWEVARESGLGNGGWCRKEPAEMEDVEIGTIGAGPKGLRRTERDEGAARELRLGAGVATAERERTRDVDEVTEWLKVRISGGELRKGRRRPIQRSTTHRSLSRSRSRKAMRELKSEEVTSVLGERGLVRSPYRSCMAKLKG